MDGFERAESGRTCCLGLEFGDVVLESDSAVFGRAGNLVGDEFLCIFLSGKFTK